MVYTNWLVDFGRRNGTDSALIYGYNLTQLVLDD